MSELKTDDYSLYAAPCRSGPPTFDRKSVVQMLTWLAFSVSILTVAAYAIHLYLHVKNSKWETEVYGLAGYVGSKRANDDFAHGKIRVFQLNGPQENDSFTGQTDGPFEVWNHYYFPELGHPNEFSTRVTIKFYNLRMRKLQTEQSKRFAHRDSNVTPP